MTLLMKRKNFLALCKQEECGNVFFLGLVQFALRNSALPFSQGVKQVCGVRRFSSPAVRTAAPQQGVSGNRSASQHILTEGVFGSWEGGGELRSKVTVLGPGSPQGLTSLSC